MGGKIEQEEQIESNDAQGVPQLLPFQERSMKHVISLRMFRYFKIGPPIAGYLLQKKMQCIINLTHNSENFGRVVSPFSLGK